jgi:hypothetical protein
MYARAAGYVVEKPTGHARAWVNFCRCERDGYYVLLQTPDWGGDTKLPVGRERETLRRLIDAAIADKSKVPAYVLADALYEGMGDDERAVRVADLLAGGAHCAPHPEPVPF